MLTSGRILAIIDKEIGQLAYLYKLEKSQESRILMHWNENVSTLQRNVSLERIFCDENFKWIVHMAMI